MATNFPSSLNLSLHPSTSSLNSSSHHIYNCFGSDIGFQAFLFMLCTYVLFFLPLTIFIIYLGLQRCCTQSTVAAPMDVFTYNILVMETTGMLGCCLYVFSDTPQMTVVAGYFFNMIIPGQTFLHMLTCLERYIAVVHPVLYLNLRKSVGVRNGTIGLIWVSGVGWVGLTGLCSPYVSTIAYVFFMALSLVVVAFFSFFVVYTLIQPGPGERGGDRERVAQSKRRAVHTIMVITGALSLRFIGQMICVLISIFMVMSDRGRCIMFVAGLFFCVPSSYILPLLFLHRAGNLPCFTQR